MAQATRKLTYVELMLWAMGVAALTASIKVSWPALSYLLS